MVVFDVLYAEVWLWFCMPWIENMIMVVRMLRMMMMRRSLMRVKFLLLFCCWLIRVCMRFFLFVDALCGDRGLGWFGFVG